MEGGGPVAGQSGLSIAEAGANIASGKTAPTIYAYRLNGDVITINNRTLGDYTLAGVKPTNVVVTTPTEENLVRLDELGGVPSRTVPVTIGKDDMTLDPRGPGVIDTYRPWPYDR